MENKYPTIFATPKGATYTINVSQVFGDAYTFDECVHILSTASPEDTINFIINSDGGNVFSLIALRNSIRASQAEIVMSLIGMAASAGSALFLESAHSYQVHDNSCMMIHNMLCGTGFDDTQKIKTRADYNMKMNERFVRETYEGFLTKAEMDDVIYNSREIYLEDTEIRERLQKRETLKQQQLQAEQEFPESLADVDLSGLSLEELQDELEAMNEDRKVMLAEIKKRTKQQAVKTTATKQQETKTDSKQEVSK